MAFKEKSAWFMLVVTLILGASYFAKVLVLFEGSEMPSPTLPGLIKFTVSLTVFSIIGHIILASIAPKDAHAPLDEREQRIMAKASAASYTIFAFGSVLSLFGYLLQSDGNALFYGVFASLVISQLVEYASRIYFYRATF